jgi:alpha-glucosidase (family GH31 glycosyl hydrolase)
MTQKPLCLRRWFTPFAAAGLGLLLLALHPARLTAKPFEVTLGTGDVLRLEAVSPGVFRVRLSGEGRFEPSLMERYGLVRSDWPACEMQAHADGGTTTLETTAGSLSVRTSDGRLQLRDGRGQVLCEEVLPQGTRWTAPSLESFRKRQASLADYFRGEKRKQGQIQIIGSAGPQDKAEYSDVMHEFFLPTNSFGASFSLREGERLYGLGTASSKRLQLRGHGYRLWTQYRGNFGYHAQGSWEQTEGPIPLLLSTGGWGLFVNTTWVHYYDLGRYQAEQGFFWGPGGQLDFYLLIGDSLPKLIALYTEITGKPRLLPQFAYGLTYVSQITQNEHEILNDSRLFREKGIPCDILGIEPQWMKQNYDASHKKEWNPNKFYIPDWMGPDSKSGTFIGGLDRTGFKLSLWLVCNDDLTMEEERQVAIREGHAAGFPKEPDAWFNHLQKFVRNGARCFKMDPENLIQEHPGRKYYNGRTDLETHNLTQVLYHKQMCSGYEDFAKQRAMTHYCAAYAGVQHWGATTMGDNGGGPKALVWMLNYAMSGHMNTSCDMEAQGRGLHFGFLQPWSQLNNWAYAFQPWFLGKRGGAMFRDYARLRYSLLPYIYSAAHVGHLTSMPILRPMPLVYPDDPKLADCVTQYMLGDSLLVTAFTDRVYLPAGRWVDYWAGAEYQGPREMPSVYPESRAGGLFIKAGAIIPYWPEMNFVGEQPVTTLELHVYPEGQSNYTLYEDDGNSLDYLKGALAVTRIHCEAGPDSVNLAIDPRQGHYDNMPAQRDYQVWIHVKPAKSLRLNGSDVAGDYDTQAKATRILAHEDPARKAGIHIQCEL